MITRKKRKSSGDSRNSEKSIAEKTARSLRRGATNTTRPRIGLTQVQAEPASDCLAAGPIARCGSACIQPQSAFPVIANDALPTTSGFGLGHHDLANLFPAQEHVGTSLCAPMPEVAYHTHRSLRLSLRCFGRPLRSPPPEQPSLPPLLLPGRNSGHAEPQVVEPVVRRVPVAERGSAAPAVAAPAAAPEHAMGGLSRASRIGRR